MEESVTMLGLTKLKVNWEPILAFRDQIKEKCCL